MDITPCLSPWAHGPSHARRRQPRTEGASPRARVPPVDFYGRNADRSCAAIRLRDIHPPRWPRPVRSRVHSVVQVGQPAFQPFLVHPPHHAIHTCRRVRLHLENAQRSASTVTWWRSAVRRTPGSRCTNCRIRSTACDTLSRSCVRRMLWLFGFPLGSVLGSIGSAGTGVPLFAEWITSPHPPLPLCGGAGSRASTVAINCSGDWPAFSPSLTANEVRGHVV